MSSFLGSFFYGLTPSLTAVLVLYFQREAAGWLLWLLSGVMALISLYLSVQCVVVFLHKLFVDEAGISVAGPFGRQEIRWSDVVNAVLRERANAITRADRMLVLRSRNRRLVYHTSTLSVADETEVLERVRAKTNVVVQKDKPSI